MLRSSSCLPIFDEQIVQIIWVKEITGSPRCKVCIHETSVLCTMLDWETLLLHNHNALLLLGAFIKICHTFACGPWASTEPVNLPVQWNWYLRHPFRGSFWARLIGLELSWCSCSFIEKKEKQCLRLGVREYLCPPWSSCYRLWANHLINVLICTKLNCLLDITTRRSVFYYCFSYRVQTALLLDDGKCQRLIVYYKILPKKMLQGQSKIAPCPRLMAGKMPGCFWLAASRSKCCFGVRFVFDHFLLYWGSLLSSDDGVGSSI